MINKKSSFLRSQLIRKLKAEKINILNKNKAESVLNKCVLGGKLISEYRELVNSYINDKNYLINLSNRKLDWTSEELEKAKYFNDCGIIEYIDGWHCGYYHLTETGKYFLSSQ